MGDGRDDTRAEQARFAANIVTSAAAPANFLATNPAAIKRAFNTGGMSIVRGVRNFARDVRHNGGMPSMVEPVRGGPGPGGDPWRGRGPGRCRGGPVVRPGHRDGA
jgi:hypothetical protein